MPFTTRRIVFLLCLLLPASIALCACGSSGSPRPVQQPSYHSPNLTYATVPVVGHRSREGVSLHNSSPTLTYTTVASPTVGEVFTTTNGTWTNTPTSYTYQWKHCLSAVCTNASGAGATTSSYTVAAGAPAAGDVGDTIEVVVTATNTAGSASQTSAETGTVAAAAGAIFGTQTVGATANSPGSSDGVQRANSYTATATSTVTKLSVYLQPSGTVGSQLVRGIVYGDTAGAAGARLAVTDPISFTDGSTAGWYDFTLPAGLSVTSGTTYWIGIITGPTASIVQYRYDTCSSCRNFKAQAYATGASDPFGTPSIDSQLMSVYATEAVIGSPIVTVAPAVTDGGQGGGTLSAPQAGDVLTTGNGSYIPSASSFTRRWQLCTSTGQVCVDNGTTTTTYTVVNGDVGFTLRSVIAATNATGTISAASAVSGTVVSPAPPSGTAACSNSGLIWCGDFSSGTYAGTTSQYNGGNLACVNAQSGGSPAGPDMLWYNVGTQNPSSPSVIRSSPSLLNGSALFTFQVRLPSGQVNSGTDNNNRCQLDKNGWVTSSETQGGGHSGGGVYFHVGWRLETGTDSTGAFSNPWRANLSWPSTNDGNCSFAKMGYQQSAHTGLGNAVQGATPSFELYGDQGSCGTDRGLWTLASPQIGQWYEFIFHERFTDCEGSLGCGQSTAAPITCPTSATNSGTQSIDPYENTTTGYFELWMKKPTETSYTKQQLNDEFFSVAQNKYTVCGHTLYTQMPNGAQTEQDNMRVGDYRNMSWPNTDYMDYGQVYASSSFTGAGG